jgi:hypothetical protein
MLPAGPKLGVPKTVWVSCPETAGTGELFDPRWVRAAVLNSGRDSQAEVVPMEVGVTNDAPTPPLSGTSAYSIYDW